MTMLERVAERLGGVPPAVARAAIEAVRDAVVFDENAPDWMKEAFEAMINEALK